MATTREGRIPAGRDREAMPRTVSLCTAGVVSDFVCPLEAQPGGLSFDNWSSLLVGVAVGTETSGDVPDGET